MRAIYIAGDSTAARKGPGKWPMAGWGEYLHEYVDPEVRIENRAINGRSTRSFLAEGRLEIVPAGLGLLESIPEDQLQASAELLRRMYNEI